MTNKSWSGLERLRRALDAFEGAQAVGVLDWRLGVCARVMEMPEDRAFEESIRQSTKALRDSI